MVTQAIALGVMVLEDVNTPGGPSTRSSPLSPDTKKEPVRHLQGAEKKLDEVGMSPKTV